MENKGESENEEKISESNLLRFRLEQRSFILPRYSSGMQRRNFTFTTTFAFSFTEIRCVTGCCNRYSPTVFYAVGENQPRGRRERKKDTKDKGAHRRWWNERWRERNADKRVCKRKDPARLREGAVVRPERQAGENEEREPDRAAVWLTCHKTRGQRAPPPCLRANPRGIVERLPSTESTLPSRRVSPDFSPTSIRCCQPVRVEKTHTIASRDVCETPSCASENWVTGTHLDVKLYVAPRLKKNY